MTDTVFTKYLYIALSIGFLLGCKNDDDGLIALLPEENEQFSGGETTIFDASPNAFAFQAPNLDEQNGLFFFTGNSLFNQNWVTAPASTTARDGLGPLFNSRSCSGCHFRDGRGHVPEFDGERSSGLLFRLSIPGTDAFGNNLPEPNYGGQFQDNAILGTSLEGNIRVTYTPFTITYPDGTVTTLRNPSYSFVELNYGDFSANVQVSPRVANQMIGLGLLEAIPESTILSFADIDDTDGDGISGKPNFVYDVRSQTMVLGRFGWKSNQPNLRQQIAAAFSGDLGITTTLFPNENCPPGVDCSTIPNGGVPEINNQNLDRVTIYSSTLAVPGRRNFDALEILEGKQLFEQVNCTACHIPMVKTGPHPIAAIQNQTIRPYTDLLLHDMGEGLADNTPDFDATGTEWRTPPLWGIGLIETVNNHTDLLHDGRARNIEEAILWHDGEARASKTSFMALTSSERTLLINFIKSL